MRHLTVAAILTLIMLGASMAVLAQSNQFGPSEPHDESLAILRDDPFRTSTMRGIAIESRRLEINPQVEGTLAELHIDDDQKVEKGELLAKVDDRLQVVTVEMAQLRVNDQTEIRNAELARDFAELNLKQQREAAKGGGTSPYEVRKAELEYEQAKNALVTAQNEALVAETNLRGAQIELSRYRIEAPFAGRILIVHDVEPGASVKRDTPIAILVDLDPLEAQIFMPESVEDDVREGDPFILGRVIESRDGRPQTQRLIGTVKAKIARHDAATRTLRAIFTIPNEDEQLPAGFAVYVIGPARTSIDLPAAQAEELKPGMVCRLRPVGRAEVRVIGRITTIEPAEAAGRDGAARVTFDIGQSPQTLAVGETARFDGLAHVTVDVKTDQANRIRRGAMCWLEKAGEKALRIRGRMVAVDATDQEAGEGTSRLVFDVSDAPHRIAPGEKWRFVSVIDAAD